MTIFDRPMIPLPVIISPTSASFLTTVPSKGDLINMFSSITSLCLSVCCWYSICALRLTRCALDLRRAA